MKESDICIRCSHLRKNHVYGVGYIGDNKCMTCNCPQLWNKSNEICFYVTTVNGVLKRLMLYFLN
ncbi:MAG TPA: hypothetical protein VJ583_09135 [Nitrososphaeraceae archaeon]|nr:hypothetical protein [Nitrososphaeraceae archaeon]